MELTSNFTNFIEDTSQVFDKYDVPKLAEKLGMKYLSPSEIFDKKNLKDYDSVELAKIFYSIYWALASVQIEIAYILILKEELNKPLLTEYEEKLRKLYFVHHYFMAIEACYRVFERYTCLLNAMIFT